MNASPLSKTTCQNGKIERQRREREANSTDPPTLKEHTRNSFHLTVDVESFKITSEVCGVVFAVFLAIMGISTTEFLFPTV